MIQGKTEFLKHFLTVPVRKETFKPLSNNPVSVSLCLSEEARDDPAVGDVDYVWITSSGGGNH